MSYASTFDYIYYVLQASLRLQRLGICLSHSATLDKLEALGKDFSNLCFLGGIASHILRKIDRLGLNIFICSILDLSCNSVKNNLCF